MMSFLCDLPGSNLLACDYGHLCLARSIAEIQGSGKSAHTMLAPCCFGTWSLGPSSSLVLPPSRMFSVNICISCPLILKTLNRGEELDCILGEIKHAVLRNWDWVCFKREQKNNKRRKLKGCNRCSFWARKNKEQEQSRWIASIKCLSSLWFTVFYAFFLIFFSFLVCFE